MGTVVGSLCHNDPAGDWPAAALASRATVVVRGKAGIRRVSIDEFLVDSFSTAAAAVQLSLNADGTIGRAGVALSAAGPCAVRVEAAERLLAGQKPTAELIR